MQDEENLLEEKQDPSLGLPTLPVTRASSTSVSAIQYSGQANNGTGGGISRSQTETIIQVNSPEKTAAELQLEAQIAKAMTATRAIIDKLLTNVDQLQPLESVQFQMELRSRIHRWNVERASCDGIHPQEHTDAAMEDDPTTALEEDPSRYSLLGLMWCYDLVTLPLHTPKHAITDSKQPKANTKTVEFGNWRQTANVDQKTWMQVGSRRRRQLFFQLLHLMVLGLQSGMGSSSGSVPSAASPTPASVDNIDTDDFPDVMLTAVQMVRLQTLCFLLQDHLEPDKQVWQFVQKKTTTPKQRGSIETRASAESVVHSLAEIVGTNSLEDPPSKSLLHYFVNHVIASTSPHAIRHIQTQLRVVLSTFLQFKPTSSEAQLTDLTMRSEVHACIMQLIKSNQQVHELGDFNQRILRPVLNEIKERTKSQAAEEQSPPLHREVTPVHLRTIHNLPAGTQWIRSSQFPGLFLAIVKKCRETSAKGGGDMIHLADEMTYAAGQMCRGGVSINRLSIRRAWVYFGWLIVWPSYALLAILGDTRWKHSYDSFWKAQASNSAFAKQKSAEQINRETEDALQRVRAFSQPASVHPVTSSELPPDSTAVQPHANRTNSNVHPPPVKSDAPRYQTATIVGFSLSILIWFLPFVSIILYAVTASGQCDRRRSPLAVLGHCSVDGQSCHSISIYEAWFPFLSYLFFACQIALTLGYGAAGKYSVQYMQRQGVLSALAEYKVTFQSVFSGDVFKDQKADFILEKGINSEQANEARRRPFGKSIWLCWQSRQSFAWGKLIVWSLSVLHTALPVVLRSFTSQLWPTYVGSVNGFGCTATDLIISWVYIFWSFFFSMYLFDQLRRMVIEFNHVQLVQERLIDSFRADIDAHRPDRAALNEAVREVEHEMRKERTKNPKQRSAAQTAELNQLVNEWMEVDSISGTPLSRTAAEREVTQNLPQVSRFGVLDDKSNVNRLKLLVKVFQSNGWKSSKRFSPYRLSLNHPNSVRTFMLLRQSLLIDCQQEINTHTVLLTLCLVCSIAIYAICALEVLVTLTWQAALSRVLALIIASLMAIFSVIAIHTISRINQLLAAHSPLIQKAYAEVVFATGVTNHAVANASSGTHRASCDCAPSEAQANPAELHLSKQLLFALGQLTGTQHTKLTILGFEVTPNLNTLIFSLAISTLGSIVSKYAWSSTSN